jgi:hypothetical protein
MTIKGPCPTHEVSFIAGVKEDQGRACDFEKVCDERWVRLLTRSRVCGKIVITIESSVY